MNILNHVHIKKFTHFALKHKFISFLVVAVVLGGGYRLYKSKSNTVETRYVLAYVEKGTLVNSISGSGQVSVLNQADIKPKTGGEVTAIYVKAGQEIKSGALLAQIDARDAARAVRDAQTSLETAKLDLEKFLQPADELDLLQSENSLIQTKETKQKAEDNLKKAYEDGFNSVANTFLDIPAIMTGLNDVLFTNSFNSGQYNIDFYAGAVKSYDDKALQYRDDAYNAYQTARAAYDKNFADYKQLSRFSDTNLIEASINQTYETAKSIAEAVKNANNLIQFYADKLVERNLKPQTLASAHLSTLDSYTGTTNSNISSLLSIQRTIQDSKDSIISASRSIEEKKLSLAKIKDAPDPLDVRAKKIVIQQKEDALVTANQALADHYIRAPFDGVVAKIIAKKGDSVSSGAALFTFITKQRIAELSLNEIDVVKVKVGQKVTLTFDAVEGFSVAGDVVEVDAIGTVTQGVVVYNVKIGFDTQDERVKPGMSVSANIITDVKQGVLIVPGGAVKTQNNGSYVEMFDQPTQNPSSLGITSAVLPRQQAVEIGLSNGVQIEIISGIKEGDQVISRTVNTAAAPAPSQVPSLFGNVGGNRGGGGSTRMPTH